MRSLTRARFEEMCSFRGVPSGRIHLELETMLISAANPYTIKNPVLQALVNDATAFYHR